MRSPPRGHPCGLEESLEEGFRRVRDAHDLVRRLTIELEIELGSGLAVLPLGQAFELAPPQWALREPRAPDGDAHARRLPGDAALPGDRFGGGDHAAGDEALAA